ncbi:hypothetical protein MtrunA17_Chr8g0345351 [Medicago truncatula]|uniref:Uncharacterized protein n=1 Tax=Medicago truncatula TaxID=3880 RepID=A0A396GDU9_MEDTR|nr:hypothetical protein MtrunA17_Chr8g0345351 [Medicago truncatula]
MNSSVLIHVHVPLLQPETRKSPVGDQIHSHHNALVVLKNCSSLSTKTSHLSRIEIQRYENLKRK